jgi:hypothetical protein
MPQQYIVKSKIGRLPISRWVAAIADFFGLPKADYCIRSNDEFIAYLNAQQSSTI